MRKYRLSMFALLLGVCVFFGLQCDRTILPVVDSSDQNINSDETIESNETITSHQTIDYLQGNTVTRVIIKILDNHSMAPISGAMITVVGIDSAMSDSTGTVFFDSMKTGSYMLVCARNGFESSMDNLSLSIDSNSNTVPVVNQSTDVVFLARNGAAIKGNLYYEDDGAFYPVSGATVECRSTNRSITFQRPLVTTTSDDGMYSFGGLPEYSNYSLMVIPFQEEAATYTQAAPVNLAGRGVGDTLRATDIILDKSIDGTFIILNNNLETFTREDSLMFEFSEAVDTDELGNDSIYITLSPGNSRILTKLIWKENNEKLFIIPFDGVWNALQVYTLSIRKISSVEGKPLDNTDFISYNFTPSTTGSLGDVDSVRFRVGASDTNKIDYNTSSITLLWSDLENALTYDIFQKSTSDSSWVFLLSSTNTTTNVTTTGKFSSGMQMQFIILGRNSSSVSSFETATVLTARDQKPPLISSSLIRTGFDNSSSSSIDTVEITIPLLPEPMDTTLAPVASIKEASYVIGSTQFGDTSYTIDPDNCFWTWSTTRTGVMSVVIDSLSNAAYDSLFIDFSSVTDVAGNKPDTTANTIGVETRP